MSSIQFENVVSPPAPRQPSITPPQNGDSYQRTVVIRREDSGQLAYLIQIVQEASPAGHDPKTLEMLKASVQSGTYVPDTERLANNLMNHLVLGGE
ncbi:hypothetical protein Lgee_0765 [Legionella geestiana]|uniref:Uncharacterized protein n=1 Tax=Legionella geestiana TaxID=45065 RepID=A0A0W0U3M2_9GAMM|nr:flagellar biosynthesis anti-sigma factor FlgM [Legionella geestiana]KTD02073.1 hypothetical protein Lgee_0765 [Legionella geestiana]QBS11870.1 flagellar biosynthesis anti-sigma factor FlgM [Legionella geestiana]QDQ40518.1 flagellar biosynthesis anti-sigma factor FlgM [Legionella geestiana]STX53430.1 Uncharacterised protein [Legionella geestiana]